MKCKDCKFRINIGNTDETGAALCSFPSSYFPVTLKDNCHYLPESKELTCGDCARLEYDPGCIGCLPEENASRNGGLCFGFRAKKEEELSDILWFLVTHDLLDQDKIKSLLEEVEDNYKKLTDQG